MPSFIRFPPYFIHCDVDSKQAFGVEKTKAEYRNPCLRRSGFAQAGKTNPSFLNFILFRKFEIGSFEIVSRFVFRASDFSPLSRE
jgi:hypothetical protein